MQLPEEHPYFLPLARLQLPSEGRILSGDAIMGRKKINSMWDAPDPRTVRGHLKKEQALFELLFGDEDIRSIKAKFKQEVNRKRRNLPDVRLNQDDMDCIIDIQRLWELGTFRHIPEVVANRLFAVHNPQRMIDAEALCNPRPGQSGWSNRIVVSMGLEMLRLYLMGADPYMRKVIRNVLTANGKKMNMKRLLHGVNHSAEALNAEVEYDYEDDDDFDFSSLEEWAD